jgi:uncharacterized protein (TIRG00374 family)
MAILVLLLALLYRRGGHLALFINTLLDSASAFRAFLVTALVLTFAAVCIDFAVIQLLLKSTGATLTLSYAGFVLMASGLVGLVSRVPRGLGFFDLSSVVLFTATGVGRAAAGASVMLYRGMDLLKCALYYSVLILLKRPS